MRRIVHVLSNLKNVNRWTIEQRTNQKCNHALQILNKTLPKKYR